MISMPIGVPSKWNLENPRAFVIPANAGIQCLGYSRLKALDPGLTSFAVEKRLAGMTSLKDGDSRSRKPE